MSVAVALDTRFLCSADDMRQTVVVSVFDVLSLAGLRLTPQAFVNELQNALDIVPEQFRDTVELDLRHDGLGGIDSCRASYRRRETDDEMVSRKQEAVIRRQKRAAADREYDRQEFERLKAIFEPAAPDTVAQL